MTGAAFAILVMFWLCKTKCGGKSESVTIIMRRYKKHRKNCECCPRHSLFKGHNVNVNIVVLNCQKCDQCLKCQVSSHKSLGLLSSLIVIVFVIVFVFFDRSPIELSDVLGLYLKIRFATSN